MVGLQATRLQQTKCWEFLVSTRRMPSQPKKRSYDLFRALAHRLPCWRVWLSRVHSRE
jgi:hypothetical protein